MRMWNVPTEYMCRQHLLGEHLELHMFVSTINMKKSVEGYMTKGLLEPEKIDKRHDELVQEMEKRNYKHKSPLKKITYDLKGGLVNTCENIEELKRRCPKCRQRIKESLSHHTQMTK